MRSTGVVLGLLVPFLSSAHHAVTAPFMDEEIQIEGVVTEFNFVNPHVNIILNVTDEYGSDTLWMATAAAPDSLRRTGWSADSIQAGQHLRISGMKSRQGRPMILVERAHWDGGGIVELSPVDGAVVRTLTGASNRIQDGPNLSRAPLPATLGDGRPNLTGYWAKHVDVRAVNASPGRNSPPLNERGERLQAGFDALNDPSYSECAAHGLVRQASTVKPLRITQHTDRVVFDYEEGAAQRVIYLGGRASGVSSTKTNLGNSTARYEDGTLVVESDQLLGNLTGIFGNALSDEHTTVETYRRIDDDTGPSLEMVLVTTDPTYLAGPWEITWKRYYAAEYEFTEVDCRLPLTGN